MKKLALACAAAAALLLGTIVVGAGPTSAAGSPIGYTVAFGEGGCDLATVDLTTGQLTDLPAAPSPEACAIDLAATADGTVWGIWGDSFEGRGTGLQATSPALLVRYAADGTATTIPITDPDGNSGGLAEGGIAVSPGGTVYVHMVTDNPGCDTGTTPDTTIGPQYAGDSVCLFTVDPTTGTATIVGTTGLFQTVFFALAWCDGLLSIADTTGNGEWVTEDNSTGAVTIGAPVDMLPAGYDCGTGTPLYALVGEGNFLDGASAPAATSVSVATVNPATGAATIVAPVSDQAVELIGLAVVPAAVTPTTPPPAVAADTVTPAFTG